MFCAAVIVAGQCVFACAGTQNEFTRAWGWLDSVHLADGAELAIGEYGKLVRQGDSIIWATESEPSACEMANGDMDR